MAHVEVQDKNTDKRQDLLLYVRYYVVTCLVATGAEACWVLGVGVLGASCKLQLNE